MELPRLLPLTQGSSNFSIFFPSLHLISQCDENNLFNPPGAPWGGDHLATTLSAEASSPLPCSTPRWHRPLHTAAGKVLKTLDESYLKKNKMVVGMLGSHAVSSVLFRWFNLCFNNLFVPGYIFVLVVHQFTTFCCLCLNQPVAPSHTVQQHLKTSLGGNHEGDKTSVSGILCDICDEDKRVSFVKVPFSHQNLKVSLTCQLQ